MILQCNAAQFDDRSNLDTDPGKLNSNQTGNNITSTKKAYSKQEVFHLLPDLINRSIEVNGNPDQGVVTALSLMQHNIDTILFDGNTAKTHNIKLDSNLLSEIEQLIINNAQKDQHVAIDHDTVDVIKMMFDVIFEDDRLTDDIKLMFARLQVPLLKVAILDKSYFSGETHPAEVLVNKLTDVALELRKNNGPLDASFINEVSFIVSRVLNEFSDDASVFKKIINTSPLLNGKKLNGKKPEEKLHNTAKSITQLRETTEKLKSLARKNEAKKKTTTETLSKKTSKINLKSVSTDKPAQLIKNTNKKPVKIKPASQNQLTGKASPATQAVTKPVKRPAKQTNMNQLIASAIMTRAIKSDLPEDVKEFLLSSWTTVATNIYKSHGENNPVWKKTMLAVDDIIWAFQPKTSKMDKLRLSSIIPGILTTIQDGLILTRQHSDHKSKLFSQLLAIHAANLKEQRLQKPA